MRRYVARFVTILVLILSTFTCLDLLYQDNKYKLKPTTMTTTTTDAISTTTTTTQTTTTTVKTTKKTTKKVITTTKNNGTYTLTHYGWDCKGCGGNTASGYNVRNTIYYKDPTYGSLRIVAMRNVPLYSVIKINNYDGQDIMAIVLDRCKSGSIVDLLVQNENTASKLGIRRNIEIEVLRYGKN